jgi:DeoR family transcriptional regulator of aga operon
LNIAAVLLTSSHISTIIVGGELNVESQSVTGPMALESLRIYGIRCDKAFIGTGGVSAKFGVTNRILERLPLKRMVMEISNEVAVVADGSKIGVVTLGHIAPIEAFQLLITDKSAPVEELEKIEAYGVKIKIADS